MDEKKIQFEDLHLKPGQKVFLEFEGFSNLREPSFLIGYRAGRSIIVSTPIIGGSPFAVKLGTKVAVRLFANQINGACAFRSEIIHLSAIPYHHLHLAPPKELEIGEVRKAVRAQVDLICSVFPESSKDARAGIIRDLSDNGARLICQDELGNVGETITIVTKLHVVGLERIVKLKAIIRSINLIELDTAYGIQFVDMKPEEIITLHAFVMSHLNTTHNS